MKTFLKYLYHSTLIGKFFIQFWIDLHHFYWTRIVSDKVFIKRTFRKAFKYPLDLHNPQTLNEKINWLKLYDRTPLHTQCADKFAVRSYIAEQIGEEYLVPLYFHTFKAADIIINNLPDSPCIIKTNHDSGGVYICRDKTKIDLLKIRLDLKKRLKRNYYYNNKEWQYNNIRPTIIVEKLLMDNGGNIPLDYKLHCINQKVQMIQVDIGRGTEKHHRNWYNVLWEREPYKWSSSKGKNKYTDPNEIDIARPVTLEKMVFLSEKLSAPFVYVRVDWYDVDGKLFFGELTFHHDSGYRPIEPKEWDLKLGDLLKLPEAKMT